MIVAGREEFVKNLLWDAGYTVSVFYPIAVYKCIGFLSNLQFICVSRDY